MELDIPQLVLPVVTGWRNALTRASEFKDHEFGKAAKEAMLFFDGPHNWMWDSKYAKGEDGYLSGADKMDPPPFRMTLNRVSECVQLFAPSLYPRNPYRTVTPRANAPLTPMSFMQPGQNPADPMMQMMYQQIAQQEMIADAQRKDIAAVLESYLNYTPNELELEWHVRRAIDEAIIKGMSLLVTELYQPVGFQSRLVGTFYQSVDDLLMDPDAECWEDIQWTAIEYVRHYRDVEDEFGWPRDSLKNRGAYESIASQSGSAGDKDSKFDRERDGKKDLIRYWKIYSKCGFGHRDSGLEQLVQDTFDAFGKNCYLVVAEGVDYPLNLHPDKFNLPPEELFMEVQWPIPFWADGRWPFTPVMFHEKPGSVWPISHIKPGIGQLRLLNWVYSFLAAKIRSACTTTVGVMKAAGDELKSALLTGTNGFTIFEIESLLDAKSINDLVTFVQAPDVQPSILTFIQMVENSFEKATGLQELAYGMASTQSRSAADVQIRQSNSSVRVDDMIKKTRRALTMAARSEAFAARWLLEPQDVAPVIGQPQAFVWQQRLMTTDIEQVVREYEFRIESGDGREPTKETRVEQANQALQSIGPILQAAMNVGQVDPVNKMLAMWWAANDLAPPAPQIQPPPPPPMMGPPGQEQGPPPPQ